jgi:hypothetical protein
MLTSHSALPRTVRVRVRLRLLAVVLTFGAVLPGCFLLPRDPTDVTEPIDVLLNAAVAQQVAGEGMVIGSPDLGSPAFGELAAAAADPTRRVRARAELMAVMRDPGDAFTRRSIAFLALAASSRPEEFTLLARALEDHTLAWFALPLLVPFVVPPDPEATPIDIGAYEAIVELLSDPALPDASVADVLRNASAAGHPLPASVLETWLQTRTGKDVRSRMLQFLAARSRKLGGAVPSVIAWFEGDQPIDAGLAHEVSLFFARQGTPEAVPLLLRFLAVEVLPGGAAEAAGLRADAARALARCATKDNREVADALVARLTDDVQVKLEVACALAQLGIRMDLATEYLLALIQLPAEATQLRAAQALLDLREARSIPALVHMAESAKSLDARAWARSRMRVWDELVNTSQVILVNPERAIWERWHTATVSNGGAVAEADEWVQVEARADGSVTGPLDRAAALPTDSLIADARTIRAELVMGSAIELALTLRNRGATPVRTLRWTAPYRVQLYRRENAGSARATLVPRQSRLKPEVVNTASFLTIAAGEQLKVIAKFPATEFAIAGPGIYYFVAIYQGDDDLSQRGSAWSGTLETQSPDFAIIAP